MAEEIILEHLEDKEARYQSFIRQLEALIQHESNAIANVGNILAAMKYSFQHLWVGVYLVEEEELVLHLFQGPIACTRIQKGKGVCGTSWQKNEIILVPNVDEFSGHIACSSASKSEIVLPLRNASGQVFGVLDIDSEFFNAFDEVDAQYLSIIAKLIENEYAA